MPPDPTEPTAMPAPPPLEIDRNIVRYEGSPVGEYVDGYLVLNLGWCRIAGLGIKAQDDPAHDHHRNGLVLDRPA